MRKSSPKYRALASSEGILLRDQLLAIGREHNFTEEELRSVVGMSPPAFEKLLRLPDSNVAPNAYTRFRLAKAIHELGGTPTHITVSKAWIMVNLGRGTDSSSRLVKLRYSPDMTYRPMNGKPWGQALEEARAANRGSLKGIKKRIEEVQARHSQSGPVSETPRAASPARRAPRPTPTPTPVRTPAPRPRPEFDAPLYLATAAFLMALVGILVLGIWLLSQSTKPTTHPKVLEWDFELLPPSHDQSFELLPLPLLPLPNPSPSIDPSVFI